MLASAAQLRTRSSIVLVNSAGIETRTSDNGVGYFDASGRLPW